jgi:DNA-binding Lrp family transcriptional regulator
LRGLFDRKETTARLNYVAHWQYGYPLAEIADHMGVHPTTVSRRLKQAEKWNV